jgi:hypothetical protein
MLATSRYGAGLSPDSAIYLAAARHWMAGRGVLDLSGRPLVLQPPLYPVALALAATTMRTDPLAIAGGMNAILFGLIVYLAGLVFFQQCAGSPVLAILGTFLVGLSKPLFEMAVMAWSEPLFIALVVAWLALNARFMGRPTNLGVVALAVVTAAACLTRYVGVALLFCGVITVGSSARRAGRSPAAFVTGYVCLSATPLALWLLRNHHLTGTLAGPRAVASAGLGANALLALRTIVGWYAPGDAGILPKLLVVALALAILAALLIAWNTQASKTARAALIFPAGIVVLVYLAALVILASRNAIDSIDDRLLSPVSVPLTLIAVTAIAPWAEGWNEGRRDRRWGWIAVAAGAAWIQYSLTSLGQQVSMRHTEGAGGYNTRPWRESEIVRYLSGSEGHLRGPIYSNAPEALYILTGLEARTSPKRTLYNSPQVDRSLPELAGTWPVEGSAWLVWFDRERRDYLYPVDQLERVAEVRPTRELVDGAVYSVTRRRARSE